MRAFIALELPEEFAEDVEGLVRVLRGSVEGRFQPREKWHLTLAFLGEVGESEAAAAIDALEEVCAATGPVPLAARGLGSFRRGKDKVLYLDIEPAPELLALAACLREGLAARDVSFDGKSFVPHITLVRRALMVAPDLGDLPFPLPDAAHTATLFRSYLSPEGATYKALHSVELTRESEEGA